MKFLRRLDTSEYLENQTIDTSGASADVENLLIGTDLQALEIEIEGKRYVLLAYESKN